ncbi:claudin-10-like isoform X9 [Brachyhypopomus gauderio]|uniref:claudin-10-like isoform X9 n=1 Tax=Brachyhypopomus gauderio TaxID=698409 RepID=UPI004041A64F
MPGYAPRKKMGKKKGKRRHSSFPAPAREASMVEGTFPLADLEEEGPFLVGASYIQVCRGLMISAVCLGFFATACALVGMKCTKIGGNDQVKARIACFAGFQFFVSGLCSLTACSLYAHRITSEFFDPMFMAQKYELGAALFIGWGGSALCILGGVVFFLSLSDSISKSSSQADKRRYLYSADSYVSSHGKIHNQLANGRRPPAHYSSTSQQFDKHAYV